MNAHKMVCHLADAVRFALGERPVEEARLLRVPAPVARFVALRTPFPWPRGAPTLPEIDQERQGTPPQDFQTDREELERLMRRLSGHQGPWPRHPIFGRISPADWGRWAFRHADHHLRQFGV
jgi:hypothetical protein